MVDKNTRIAAYQTLDTGLPPDPCPCMVIAEAGLEVPAADHPAICVITDVESVNEQDRFNSKRIIRCWNSCLGMDDPEKEILELKAGNAERQALFDLQWTRTREADQLWRDAHPGKEGVTPDLGELIGWLVAERERLRDFADDVLNWSKAYPAAVFPEPTPEQVDEVCKTLGFRIDRISAMVLRAFTKQWGKKARAALGKE